MSSPGWLVPWWPALIVDRKEDEKNLTLAPGEMLPIAAEGNRMVELFNHDHRVAVLAVKCLVEYTSQIGKVSGAMAHANAVIDATKRPAHTSRAKGFRSSSICLMSWVARYRRRRP